MSLFGCSLYRIEAKVFKINLDANTWKIIYYAVVYLMFINVLHYDALIKLK
jgi:hypothetical protein